MNPTIKIILYIGTILTISIQCCESSTELTKLSLQARCDEIIIRAATKDDLNALTELSHKAYNNDFKSLWQKNYAELTPSYQTIEDFIEEKEESNNNSIKNFIKQQKKTGECALLVATEKNSIVGYCKFKKMDLTTMYMNNIFVDESHRQQKIAKKLIIAAFNKWNNIKTCCFKSFIHNDLVNKLCSQYNHEQKREISFNPKTGKVISDQNASKTHYEYTYAIQTLLAKKQMNQI